MAIKGMFFNAVENGGVYDRMYSASDFVTYLHNIVGNGVFPNPSTQLQVYSATDMRVLVSPGEAWIEGHKLTNTQEYYLTISQASALYARIDRVVAYCDYENRRMGIRVNEGTPSATPQAPAINRDSTVYELGLATIYVGRGATSITTANITDTRMDSDVCGWAAGLIEQVDTSTLFDQYNAAYADYFDVMQGQFQNYFLSIEDQIADFVETLTEELKVNTYLTSFEWRETVTTLSGPDIDFTPVGYSYDPSDVIFVYLNGMLCVKDVDYTTSVSNNTLTISYTYTNPNEVDNELEIRVLKTRIALRIISALGNNVIVDHNNNYLGG